MQDILQNKNIQVVDLEINNYKLYQDKTGFMFGIDAVLLANFALRYAVYGINTKLNMCDLCSGNLPIPLIMYAKSNTNLKITTFEIDEMQVELSKKSVILNSSIDENIVENINVVNEDIKNIFLDKEKYKHLYNTFDIITCNPPYIKKGHGIINENDRKMVARHEIKIEFDDICKVSSLLLKSNKKFMFVHEPYRLMEIERTLKKYNFEIKNIEFVYPNRKSEAILMLVEAVKGAKTNVRIKEPIIIYDDNGEYTDEVKKIYGK